MGGWTLFYRLTGLTLKRLCRQLWLLAGLAALCAALPLLAGRAAEAALSGGAAFSGITLAVTSPEDGGLPRHLAQLLGGMDDLSRYCRVEAMDREEALAGLEAGRVTAVLELPEDFVRGVQSGENPGLRIIVDGERPLESLLTLWAGQSAADLLAAAQSGIYAVLAEYDQSPPGGLSREQAVAEINIKYVQWTLNRQNLFREEKLLPTGALPIALHYELSLLSFLFLSTAPLFAWSCQEPWLSGLRRLRYARRSPLWGLAAGWAACFLTGTAAAFPALLAFRLPAIEALETAAIWAVFFAAWTSACALLTESAAGCGGLSFLTSLLALALSGGVVPPVLLPEAARPAMDASPVAWMRALAAEPLGYAAMDRPAGRLLAAAAGLCLLSGWLYVRRTARKEAGLLSDTFS